MPKQALLDALLPLAKTIAGLDLTHAEGAQAQLEAAHPIAGLSALSAQVLKARDDGWLTPRGGDGLFFGRVCKASDATFGLSVDAVDMIATGPVHTHPNGEVSLCFTDAGTPKFMGQPEGWVIEPPGSRHVPTVTDGRMVILYFLPGGAMRWE